MNRIGFQMNNEDDENIYEVFDKYVDSSKEKLTKAADKLLKLYKSKGVSDDERKKLIDLEKRLRLVGHASKTGSETIEGKRINMEISITRAQTIKNMLINKGFDGNNIEVFGKGDLEPLKKEAEEFGEAVNRRVEVFFISN